MQKHNFDKDWKFILDKNTHFFTAFGFRKGGCASGPAGTDYHEGLMRDVSLPHDWGIELLPDKRCNTANAARPVSRYMPPHKASDGDSHVEDSSIGWYRKHFTLPKGCDNKRIFLEFDGVFRDCVVFVNGFYIDRHASGYTGFVLDITDQVYFADDNVVAVRVDASQPEGWWYEGAGIYRHVRLAIADELHIPQHTTFIKTTNQGDITIETSLVNKGPEERHAYLQCGIYDKQNQLKARAHIPVKVPAYGESDCNMSLHIDSPLLWDTQCPNLYEAKLSILTQSPDNNMAMPSEETMEDSMESSIEETIRFGFREFTYDPNQGMFLNGKHLKIHGACIHQDFGGFGVALPDRISRYKIELLKSMGVNGYRASHHPASEDILKACDELGVLVLDEARVVGSSPEALRQVRDLVRQHRNHPCIFMWSLGNEEYANRLQSTKYGKRMVATVCREILALDNTRELTLGANNGSVHEGVNSLFRIRGFNYARNMERLTHDAQGQHLPGYHADRYHKEHPSISMMGTEEASHFLCRGAGFDDYAKGRVSSVGDNTQPGGSTPEGWVKFYEKRDYLIGGFMWTGIDYYGEPSPFTDLNLSSSFGAIDLVGFPKNSYYYYQSCWLEEPILKLLPHWDFEPGSKVKIAAYTNCEQVTLYLNGHMIGEKQLQRFDSAIWELTFEPGRLEAVGIRNGVTYRCHLDTPGPTSRICLSPDQSEVCVGDTVIVDVSLTDKNGILAASAENLIDLTCEGAGRIIGIGNGNPSSFEPDKYLEEVQYKTIDEFLVYRKTAAKSAYTETAAMPGVPQKQLYIVPREDDLSDVETIPYIDSRFKYNVFEPRLAAYEDDHRIIWWGDSPDEYMRTLIFEKELNNVTEYEFIEFERLFGRFEVYLNDTLIGDNSKGELGTVGHQLSPFRFYCNFREGTNHLKVIVHGKNTAQIGIYNSVKLGKKVPAVWKRKAFYGLLRLFVEATEEGNITLRATSEGLAETVMSINVKQ